MADNDSGGSSNDEIELTDADLIAEGQEELPTEEYLLSDGDLEELPQELPIEMMHAQVSGPRGGRPPLPFR